MHIIIILLFVLILFILFVTRPIAVEFFNVHNLYIYISIRYAIRLLERPYSKENYQYILNLCSRDKRFTNDFCTYCNSYSQIVDIHTLGYIIYNYVQLKELN